MPPENGKVKKGTPKGCVSTSATADLHTYFLLRSAKTITFLQKKTMHQLSKFSHDVGMCEDRPAKGGGTKMGRCCVFVHENEGGRNF